jgi:hypothetical protein
VFQHPCWCQEQAQRCPPIESHKRVQCRPSLGLSIVRSEQSTCQEQAQRCPPTEPHKRVQCRPSLGVSIVRSEQSTQSRIGPDMSLSFVCDFFECAAIVGYLSTPPLASSPPEQRLTFSTRLFPSLLSVSLALFQYPVSCSSSQVPCQSSPASVTP